jgi:hypothetical protein
MANCKLQIAKLQIADWSAKCRIRTIRPDTVHAGTVHPICNLQSSAVDLTT